MLDCHECLYLGGCVQTSPGYSFIPSKQAQARRRELKAKVDQLQGTRTALRRMKAELQELAQGRSLLLPPELMGITFGYYVHLYGQHPETLLLVCRTWHVLALFQPTLWTNLDPLGQFGVGTIKPWAGTFIQSRIARSNPVPLNVDFSRLSWVMTPNVTMKIAGTGTLRSRVRNLVITRSCDAAFLLGDQPLLNSLTLLGGYLDQVIANPKKFKLAEKNLTTLRFKCSPKLEVWPEALLQRLHTLEVTLTGDPRILQECWTMIQKSTALHSLHIAGSYGCSAPLSHRSVQRLSVVYPNYSNANHVYSLEEVRMPRLRDVSIEAWDPKALKQLKLIDAPVLSLHLKCQRPCQSPHMEQYDLIEELWVDAVVPLLRSMPRLEEMELLAPLSLITRIMGNLEKELSLCPELRAFTVTAAAKKPGEGEGSKDATLQTSEELKGVAAAVISQRFQRLSSQ